MYHKGSKKYNYKGSKKYNYLTEKEEKKYLSFG